MKSTMEGESRSPTVTIIWCDHGFVNVEKNMVDFYCQVAIQDGVVTGFYDHQLEKSNNLEKLQPFNNKAKMAVS